MPNVERSCQKRLLISVPHKPINSHDSILIEFCFDEHNKRTIDVFFCDWDDFGMGIRELVHEDVYTDNASRNYQCFHFYDSMEGVK